MDESRAETVFGVTAVLTGLGVVSLALFPFALPFAILLGLAALPLLPVAIVGGLVAALVAVPVFAARALRRRRAGAGRATAEVHIHRAMSGQRATRQPRGLAQPR